jgi:hypothetical protein
VPEREGVKVLTPQQRRKAVARARVDLVEVIDAEEAPPNRAARRAMERELVKQMRRRRADG